MIDMPCSLMSITREIATYNQLNATNTQIIKNLYARSSVRITKWRGLENIRRFGTFCHGTRAGDM